MDNWECLETFVLHWYPLGCQTGPVVKAPAIYNSISQGSVKNEKHSLGRDEPDTWYWSAAFSFSARGSWESFVVILVLTELPLRSKVEFWQARPKLAIAWWVGFFSKMKDTKLKLSSCINKNTVEPRFSVAKQKAWVTSLTGILDWVYPDFSQRLLRVFEVFSLEITAAL